jgi:hypothetical protein
MTQAKTKSNMKTIITKKHAEELIIAALSGVLVGILWSFAELLLIT